MDRRALACLTVGHSVVDLCQGAVPALLPFFIHFHGLSYTQAGWVVLAATIASAVVQPAFGLAADHISAGWLLPTSLLVTGGGLVAACFAPGYLAALIGAGMCGLGVAAFHPEAARLVYFAAGDRLATGMSYFSVGGSIGFTAAPLVVIGLLEGVGPRGLAAFLLPAVAAAAVCIAARARFVTVTRGHAATDAEPPPAQRTAFVILGLLIAVRSGVYSGLMAFLALYWVHVLSGTTVAGNVALAVLLGTGIIGTLAGGRLADAVGRQTVTRGGMLAVTVGLIAFARADGLAAWTTLVLIGVALSLGSSVLVVMGQEYLPGRVGVASGITIGVAVSCGGLSAPAIGAAADAYGLTVLPSLLAGLAAVATGLAFLLPPPRHQTAGLR